MYSQRESFLAKREAEGELTFRYVENDGAPDNSMWCACHALSLTLQCIASAADHHLSYAASLHGVSSSRGEMCRVPCSVSIRHRMRPSAEMCTGHRTALTSLLDTL